MGKRVRSETKINEGVVSIGSAAVDLAEDILGNLKGKVVLVIGAGEIGTLVAKALAKRDIKVIYVANRTFCRAEKLGKELGGHAVRFDELESYMKISDVVISATNAPHFILKANLVERVMKERNEEKLVLIDIANPRDIEPAISSIEGVELYTIDDLRGLSERNKEKRKKEIKKVERIIEEEMEKLKKEYRLKEVKKVLKLLYEKAEGIRKKECLKAKNIIDELQKSNLEGNGNGNRDKCEEVIENLTHSTVYKILADPTKEIKKAVKESKEEKIALAKELFGLEE